jgi:hypothetical protein
MAKEREHICRYPYGLGSRLEIGEYLGRKEGGIKGSMVVGIDPSFPGKELLQYKLINYYSTAYTSTLEQTCKNAITRIIKNRK